MKPREHVADPRGVRALLPAFLRRREKVEKLFSVTPSFLADEILVIAPCAISVTRSVRVETHCESARCRPQGMVLVPCEPAVYVGVRGRGEEPGEQRSAQWFRESRPEYPNR